MISIVVAFHHAEVSSSEQRICLCSELINMHAEHSNGREPISKSDLTFYQLFIKR